MSMFASLKKAPKKAYRSIVDHLTKVIGFLGTGLMSMFAFVDPASIRANAELYLGAHAAEKMGTVLFILVILRGFYTGWKAKQAQETKEGK